MDKLVSPCFCDMGDGVMAQAYCRIKFSAPLTQTGSLTICGAIGVQRGIGSVVGQCIDEIRAGEPNTAEGWTAEMLATLCDIWENWHGNATRPYCPHQKALGWDKRASKRVAIDPSGETEALGYVTPAQHPDGLLGKPCPICGHRYNVELVFEEAPPELIQWLDSLPETKDDVPFFPEIPNNTLVQVAA